MPDWTKKPDTARLHDLMSRFREGQDSAGELLCDHLQTDLRKVADGFLGPEDPDRDDLVQDALVALLAYLKQGGAIPANPQSFASTIIRNRCRNLFRWRKYRPSTNLEKVENYYKSPESSPLDLLLDDEVLEGLNSALQELDPVCAELLTGIYLKQHSMERLSRMLGLNSVQAVYYRRNQCLEKIKKIFEKRGFGSPEHGKIIRISKGRQRDGNDNE